MTKGSGSPFKFFFEMFQQRRLAGTGGAPKDYDVTSGRYTLPEPVKGPVPAIFSTIPISSFRPTKTGGLSRSPGSANSFISARSGPGGKADGFFRNQRLSKPCIVFRSCARSGRSAVQKLMFSTLFRETVRFYFQGISVKNGPRQPS